MSSIFSASGSTSQTMDFLKSMANDNLLSNLSLLAQQGANALAATTPVDTGLTATSWGYEIEVDNDHAAVYWTNTHENEGVNVAVIIQYGHATGNGAYITGIDYINPTMQSIFDQIIDAVWKKVTLA